MSGRTAVALTSGTPPLTLPSIHFRRDFDSLATLPDLEYGVPTSRNFSAVDAVIAVREQRYAVALQITVSAQHGYSAAGLVKVKTDLKLTDTELLHVILVCPPDVFDDVQLLESNGRVLKVVPDTLGSTGLRQYKLSVAFD